MRGDPDIICQRYDAASGLYVCHVRTPDASRSLIGGSFWTASENLHPWWPIGCGDSAKAAAEMALSRMPAKALAA